MSDWSRKKDTEDGTRKKSRRRLKPDVRRTELLDAAFEVMKRMGPDGARVEDITRQAGAAKGTFLFIFFFLERPSDRHAGSIAIDVCCRFQVSAFQGGSDELVRL